jgi:microcystin-dependent protein
MSEPYVGELMLVPYNFAPVGWMFCQGQILPISEYDTLFNLIGTTFVGDGQSTFALPDLRGRTAIAFGPSKTGTNYVIGQSGGVENVTLNGNQMPLHNHQAACSNNPQNSANAAGSILATAATGVNMYSPTAPSTPMGASISTVGGNQAHENRQPYLTLNWCISLFGVYPSQG